MIYDVKRCFYYFNPTVDLISHNVRVCTLNGSVCVWSVNKSYPYLTLGLYKRFIYINGLPKDRWTNPNWCVHTSFLFFYLLEDSGSIFCSHIFFFSFSITSIVYTRHICCFEFKTMSPIVFFFLILVNTYAQHKKISRNAYKIIAMLC